LQFIDDTDRNLEIYKYNGPSTHSCIPVDHFNFKGMNDAGEIITNTLIREFAEEALNNQTLKFDEKSGVKTKSKSEEILKKFFSQGLEVI
jgi:hypothetical protein